MGVYVFNTEILVRRLIGRHPSRLGSRFGEHHSDDDQEGPVFASIRLGDEEDGLLEDVGTIDAYFDATMDSSP